MIIQPRNEYCQLRCPDCEEIVGVPSPGEAENTYTHCSTVMVQWVG